MAWLLEVRKIRADLPAGKPAPARKNEASRPAVRPPGGGALAEPPGTRKKDEFGGLFAPGLVDENIVIVSKYHAAKLLVYYLQHLEGDGKGSRMYNLIWHLRQWADELAVQRIGFTEKADAFRKTLNTVEARAQKFDKLETEY